MLGIRRQDTGPCLERALHEEIAGANQAFLVGQRDGGAAIDRRERGLQSGRAADGGHDPVGRAGRSFHPMDRGWARFAGSVPTGLGRQHVKGISDRFGELITRAEHVWTTNYMDDASTFGTPNGQRVEVRALTLTEYNEAGALTSARVCLGIREVPVSDLVQIG